MGALWKCKKCGLVIFATPDFPHVGGCDRCKGIEFIDIDKETPIILLEEVKK